MWNSFVSKIRGLMGGFGSLLALCNSLKSPVPMFIGIPMMMHSDTPGTKQNRGYRVEGTLHRIAVWGPENQLYHTSPD